MRKVRVLLLDDQEIVRAGVRAALEPEAAVEVVGETSSVADGCRLIRDACPDVVILDIAVEDGGGMGVCRHLQLTAPDIRTLVLTSRDTKDDVLAALDAGVTGYLLKHVGASGLLSAVRTVANGKSLIDPALVQSVVRWMEEATAAPTDGTVGLTEQQRLILNLVGEGLTNKQIAERLFLAEKTVKNHLTRILAKLGVQRRTQAARLVWKQTAR